MTAWWVAVLLIGQSPPAPVREPVRIHGQLSVLADAVPRQDAAELRPRASIEIASPVSTRVRWRAEVVGDGLVADRRGSVEDARFDVRESWIEVGGSRADVRVGFGRIVWGRLDEIQPTDVVNPLDTARFLLDGRSEARRAVAFVRGRVFAGDALTVEGILAPWFRRGVFDALDEPTSPFNLVNDAAVPPPLILAGADREQQMPPRSWQSLSGGARVQVTKGRVDLSAMAYRGFDPIGPITFEPVAPPADPPAVVGTLVEHHPRFTMVGADTETVVGEWAIRAETAAFVHKMTAGVSRPGLVPSRAVDVGAGVDRRAGNYHVFGSVVLHRQWSAADRLVDRQDVTLIGSIERRFGRDRFLGRAFGVWNPEDDSGFVRGLLTWTIRDNFGADFSAAAFLGTGDDTISRFSGRDFVFARLKYDFGASWK